MNTHPVRIALIMKEEPILLDNLPKVCQILELMSDREFKNRRDVNEVLSLKYHMLHYIVKDIKKQVSTLNPLCCVFRPANGWSACHLLVEINFLMLKQLFAYS